MTTTTISVGHDGSGPSITTTTAVVYEHDDLSHAIVAALSQEDAAQLCDAWKAQDEMHRNWTFPAGGVEEYEGIVLATAETDSVSLKIWDANFWALRDAPGVRTETRLTYSTWDFPFVVTITQED